MQRNISSRLQQLTELALLTALSLILFVIELRLPDLAPIPGVKLGLANIIIVYAAFRYQPGETVMLTVSRLLLGAIFAGNLSALLYSAAGAALCLLGMLGIKRWIPTGSIWLCSVIGAMLHNSGQICAAMLLMHTPAVLSYLPVLLVTGGVAGLFTGLCAQVIVVRMKKHRDPHQ